MHKLTLLLLASSALLAACGGHDEPLAAGLPLPPASGSRWAVLETDTDGDGLADSITRFGYDTLGRRTNQTTWVADRGTAIGAPVEVQTWVYDGASRVLTQRREVREAGVGRRSIDADYGTDGLLASTTLRWYDSPVSLRTTYTWQGQRLVEARQEGGSTPATYRLSYDEEGRVEQIEGRRDDGFVMGVDTYNWRADGQLTTAAFSLSVGYLVQYDLQYDLNGHHIRTYKTDDGFEDDMRRHFYDAAGRLERVEVDNKPSSFDEADFVADVVHRIRWEDGLCQSVVLPSLPPVFDRDITAQARADGTMLGCAD